MCLCHYNHGLLKLGFISRSWSRVLGDPPATRKAHLQVRPDGFQASLWDVFFVEVYQRVQEGVHLGHHHLGCLPAAILRDFASGCHQDHDRRRDVGHRRHGRTERLQLGQVILKRKTRRELWKLRRGSAWFNWVWATVQSLWSSERGEKKWGWKKEGIRIKEEEPVLTLRRQQRILIKESGESSEQWLNCLFCLFEQRAPFKHRGCFRKSPSQLLNLHGMQG